MFPALAIAYAVLPFLVAGLYLRGMRSTIRRPRLFLVGGIFEGYLVVVAVVLSWALDLLVSVGVSGVPPGDPSAAGPLDIYIRPLAGIPIIASLLLVAMNRRSALYGMWAAISALVATHYWALFFELPFRFLDGRHPLSYLKGFIIPTAITFPFLSIDSNRESDKRAA